VVQRPRVKLGAWLRHSTQSVDSRELQMLMDRLKHHEPETYSTTAARLRTGTMPMLLFSHDLCPVNPALLYLMHASHCALQSSQRNLPATPSTATWLSGPQQVDSAEDECDAGETPSGAVGEVWWLFDSGTPYLAEVFSRGAVPDCRLPHLDRSNIRGRHVVRVLGSRCSFAKVVSATARMCLFTAWCASAITEVTAPGELLGAHAYCEAARDAGRKHVQDIDSYRGGGAGRHSRAGLWSCACIRVRCCAPRGCCPALPAHPRRGVWTGGGGRGSCHEAVTPRSAWHVSMRGLLPVRAR
jgi:hypothetical protein